MPLKIVHNYDMRLYLVENIIQAFIKVFQVEQNNCSSCFHTDLDSVNISAHLHNIIIIVQLYIIINNIM